MSIRYKLPLLVLAAFLINILLLYGYYNLFLSREISLYSGRMQEELQLETDRIIKDMGNSHDFSQELQNIAQAQKLIVQVTDDSGLEVFRAGSAEGVNMKINAAGLFRHDGRLYLLKVAKPVSLNRISSYYVVWNLFIAEILIICLILILIAFIIYFIYVKPIVGLQKTMESYKKGIHPGYVMRRDEIGLLQNRFVKLTETIEKKKQKQNLIIASISHDIKTPLTEVHPEC